MDLSQTHNLILEYNDNDNEDYFIAIRMMKAKDKMVRSSGRRCDPVWRVCGSGGRQGGVEEAHRRGKESTEICYAPAFQNKYSEIWRGAKMADVLQTRGPGPFSPEARAVVTTHAGRVSRLGRWPRLMQVESRG
ncbi:hypothetical protein J6590_032920 [Homalodisca vitripennis]|nr:hypothetical protein J6590_032920 [Homalodisca vitripennis]